MAALHGAWCLPRSSGLPSTRSPPVKSLLLPRAALACPNRRTDAPNPPCLPPARRYWYPLSYCVSLAVQPTALIGVDASLRAPKAFQVGRCRWVCFCKSCISSHFMCLSMCGCCARSRPPWRASAARLGCLLGGCLPPQARLRPVPQAGGPQAPALPACPPAVLTSAHTCPPPRHRRSATAGPPSLPTRRPSRWMTRRTRPRWGLVAFPHSL